MKVDTLEGEKKVTTIKSVQIIDLRCKKRILVEIDKAKSFCFFISGRGLCSWFTISIDNIEVQVQPKCIYYQGNYYKTSLFQICDNYLKKMRLRK